MIKLFELNEHIRRVMALNFPQPLWVGAEVVQISESRGHFYLELAQKEDMEGIVAQAQAVIWAGEYRQLLSRHGMVLQGVLRQGLELKMLVRPEFHERYGLKLHILDLDPTFTLGQLDLQRKKTIEALKAAGLFDLNRAIPLPAVLQRLAVISSETAAGLQDFIQQLKENSFGYAFDIQLFKAAVQGINAEQEMLKALNKISMHQNKFDCVAIVRGGGSRLDLSSFDSLELCKAVAGLPLPVFTGIGHDVDETVLDMVANRALKTPTAVAEFIVQHNLLFEGEVLGLVEQMQDHIASLIDRSAESLEQILQEFRWSVYQKLQSTGIYLEALEQNLPLLARHIIKNRKVMLEQTITYCQAMHPENVLRRGFSITRKNGNAVLSSAEISEGDVLESQLSDGVVVSVAAKNKNP